MDISSSDDHSTMDRDYYSSEEDKEGFIEDNYESDLEDQNLKYKDAVDIDYMRNADAKVITERFMFNDIDENDLKDSRLPVKKRLILKTNDDITDRRVPRRFNTCTGS